MMPFEYMCGWIGMGRFSSFLKTTSGGSALWSVLYSEAEQGRSGGPTNGVLFAELEDKLECLVQVERVAIEHLNVQSPSLKIVG